MSALSRFRTGRGGIFVTDADLGVTLGGIAALYDLMPDWRAIFDRSARQLAPLRVVKK